MTTTRYGELMGAVRALDHGYGSSHRELVDNVVKAARAIAAESPTVEKVSDGYHTIDDLYRHRALLTAALFDAWCQLDINASGHAVFDPHKSRRHHDDNDPIYPGYFIVVAQLPGGQVSYHYENEYWQLFRIPTVDRPAPFDGHTPEQVEERIEKWLKR